MLSKRILRHFAARHFYASLVLLWLPREAEEVIGCIKDFQYNDCVWHVAVRRMPEMAWLRRIISNILELWNESEQIFVPSWIFACFASAAASTKQLKRGVKEVVKAIRKGQKGYVLSTNLQIHGGRMGCTLRGFVGYEIVFIVVCVYVL